MSSRELVIPALVARHAEDAAFYWSQQDAGATAFLVKSARLFHFDDLLDAHLEGLAVAGPEGVTLAFKALGRWKKAGEAFVCTWLAGMRQDEAALGQLSQYLEAEPDTLLRGAISAIARLPEGAALDLLNRWAVPGAKPVEQVAALRAMALGKGYPGSGALLSDCLCSPAAPVRAAACRTLGRWQLPELTEQLRGCLLDEDLAVRAEAAVALSRQSYPGQALEVMWQCVLDQAALYQGSSGAHRISAARRLHRWLRHLAWMVPVGHGELAALLQRLPVRQRLSFVLYHGDAVFLPLLVEAMNDPETARYAGWVWQVLTGVDLQANGLTLPEPEVDPETRPGEGRRDADNGLLLPNPGAVGRVSLPLPGGRLLLGQPFTPALGLTVLEEQPQALRLVAAHALARTLPGAAPQVRACAREQLRQMAGLRTQLDS